MVRNITGFVDGEVLGVFFHEARHLFHCIIQLMRDTGRREIVDEFSKSGDGRVTVNEVHRDLSGVEFHGVP